MSVTYTPVVQRRFIPIYDHEKEKEVRIPSMTRKLYINGCAAPLAQRYRITARARNEVVNKKTGEKRRSWHFTVKAIPHSTTTSRFHQPLVIDLTTEVVQGTYWCKELAKAQKELGEQPDAYLPRYNNPDDEFELRGKTVERFIGVRDCVNWLRKMPGMNEGKAYAFLKVITGNIPIE